VLVGHEITFQQGEAINMTVSTAIPTGSYDISYVSLLTTTVDTFVATVLTADDLSLSQIERSTQVLIVLGCFLSSVLILIVVARYLDGRDRQQSKLDDKANKPFAATEGQEGRRMAVYRRGHQYDLNKQTRSLFLIAEQALPEILQSQSWITRIWRELKTHHRWIAIVYFYSERFPRMMRIVSLATNTIIMLFLQSLTYDLTKGDDGICQRQLSETDCSKPSSAFATGENKCVWNPEPSPAQCEFVQPDNSMFVVVFVAIFSALVSTPIAIFANWVIQQVLSVPTRVNLPQNALKVAGRTKSSKNLLQISPIPESDVKKSDSVSPRASTIDLTKQVTFEKERMLSELKTYISQLTDVKDRQEMMRKS
jgi:hypothetical protein